MFKLLPLLLACIWVVCIAATPDGRYNLIRGSISSSGSSDGGGSSIGGRISISKPYQSISLTAKSQQGPKLLLQTNAVTSREDEDNSSNSNSKNNDDLDEQEAKAPSSASASASVSASASASASASGKQQTATVTPTIGSIGSAPAAVTRLRAGSSPGSASASATTTRESSLRASPSISSLINLPAGSSSSTTTTLVQHHILPAETIPLPITISTRPGLRTVIAPESITIRESTLSKVGEVVQKIPTAVSHQSQTVVHKHARVVTPIVAPAVRTTTSQVLRAYHTPLIFAPQTTVVRSVVGTAGTRAKGADIGAGTKVLAKASAAGGGGASASASASIVSNANDNGGGNSSANNNKYKYKY